MTMLKNVPTIEEVVSKAEHYKALGQTEVWMERGCPICWEHVTNIDPGGMFRCGISVSVRIVASHPCGLKLTWSLDLEHPDSNGQPGPQLNIDLVREIVSKAPSALSEKFHKWMVESALKLDEEADRYFDRGTKISQQALALRSMARSVAEGGA